MNNQTTPAQDFCIIVCTYNRSGNLESCLNALAAQKGTDRLDWEVLVVDNNSIDDTRETVRKLASRLPLRVRYLFEPEQGLNHARNAGVRNNQAKFFAFVDDDIHVNDQWLFSLFERFGETDGDSVGGRIHLDPGLAVPAWITKDMLGFLGYQDYGDEPFQMDGYKRYPFGGNMAFNRRVVDKIGYFDARLGRKGEGRKRGELFKGAETDYLHRLADAGGRIFYAPAAIVYHQIRPFQLKKKYFRTIHYNQGYQAAYLDQTEFERTLFGIPLFLFMQFARNLSKYLAQVLTQGTDAAFRQRMTVDNFWGRMHGYARRSLNS